MQEFDYDTYIKQLEDILEVTSQEISHLRKVKTYRNTYMIGLYDEWIESLTIMNNIQHNIQNKSSEVLHNMRLVFNDIARSRHFTL